MTQSSGMGKTKLMKKYKEIFNQVEGQVALMLLCATEDTVLPQDFDEHFDKTLDANQGQATKQGDKAKIRDQSATRLDSLIAKQDERRILLLVDEAHLLVQGDAGLYVVMRWWLRRTRDKHVVAVFAGTLLAHANYQILKSPLGGTRDPDRAYVNYKKSNDDDKNNPDTDKKLYGPFFILTTMAIDHVRARVDSFKDELYDIRRCGYFGRPLFAAMLKEDDKGNRALSLSQSDDESQGFRNDSLCAITKRILLSRTSDWENNHLATASVLATRVQMGIASNSFVEESTACGYGNLVQYRATGLKEGEAEFGVALA